MKNKFSFIIVLFSVALAAFSGCGFTNMFKTYDAQKTELTSTHKFKDRNKETIFIGMSMAEVISAWGEPKHIYQSPKNNYGADELWVYSNATEPFQDNTISYEVYFRENKVIKIFEFVWATRTIGLEDF